MNQVTKSREHIMVNHGTIQKSFKCHKRILLKSTYSTAIFAKASILNIWMPSKLTAEKLS